MGKNLTKVSLTGQGTYTIPAGVKIINVYGVPSQEHRRVSLFASSPASLVLTNQGQTLVAGSRSTGINYFCNPFAPFVNQTFPIPTIAPPSIVSVSSVYTHALCQDASGRIYGWGENPSGALGNNQTATITSYPVLCASGLTFKKVSAGEVFSLGLRADGSVYAWGNGANGRLGDGTTTAKSSPSLVVGGQSFISISAGGAFALALKSNGQVYAWGNNTSGQLGDGTLVPKSSPVLVTGGLSFAEISAGQANGMGRLANGDVYVWGDNTYGQLGNNSLTPAVASSPVKVVGGLSFAAISGHGGACFALLASGVAYGWGFNGAGLLGDNSIANRSSPVLVSGGKSFYQLGRGGGSGINHVVALGRDGNIYAWGDNGTGALGDGSTASKSSPVLTYFGKNYSLVTSPVLINVYSVSSATVAYNLNDPEVFNDLMNSYAGILYDSLLLEFES